MSNFTPGPWTKDKRSENLLGSNGNRVIVYDAGLSFGGGRDDESVANARLIAAAPELYEALKVLVDLHIMGMIHRIPEFILEARLALAKADGGVA